jgi:hypothetical protein
VSQAYCPHARALEQGVNCVIFTQQTYSIVVPEMHTCINRVHSGRGFGGKSVIFKKIKIKNAKYRKYAQGNICLSKL